MKKETEKSPLDYDYLPAAAPQDFTGLIPAGTVDEGEIWEYNEIFPFYPHTSIKKENKVR